MRRVLAFAPLASVALGLSWGTFASPPPAPAAPSFARAANGGGTGARSDRVQLGFDTSEAEAVLAILARRNQRRTIQDVRWRTLLGSEPYVRLKRREAEFKRDFSDSEFKAFVLSDSLAPRASELARTLREWKAADLEGTAARALAYLPNGVRIRAKVYPVIKPRSNSFVFELRKDPAIFLYLDPKLDRAQFENTVAHELHHVGYASVDSQFAAAVAAMPEPGRKVGDWMGAFGEGFAMLAAAGGPDRHPHEASPPDVRARWDRDVANFNPDLERLERFFLDTIEGRLATEDTIRQTAMSFFGVQGPWYTVGWKMAVVIEKRFGRATLIECMLDPRKLLATYNRAAADAKAAGREDLALWSPKLLAAIGARAP